MNESQIPQKLSPLTYLLAANLVVMVAVACGMYFGLLTKVERAVQTTERGGDRFQSFANEVQPVVNGRGWQGGRSNQADRRLATFRDDHQKTDALLDAAAERAKRFLEQDKKQQK